MATMRILTDQEKHDLFAQLFVRYQRQLYRYIVTLVPNRTEADDLFQQTNLTLWRTWERYDPDREFLPWAYGIAHNHVRNFLRTRQHRVVPFREEMLESLAALHLVAHDMLEERQLALTECLEMLPQRQRELVEKYYGQEEPIKVVAEREGRSPEALYKAMQRIREALFDCINNRLEIEAGL